jgi:lipopolysaccharide export system protein LptC
MRSDTLLPALPDVLDSEDAPEEPALRPVALPWYARWLDRLSAALPLLLMAALALASGWWLQRAQAPSGPSPLGLEDSGVHDYALKGFRLQHFDESGRLRLELSGDSVSHLPQQALWALQGVRVRAWPQPGALQEGWASQAQAWHRLQVLQLSGGVKLTQSRAASPPLSVSASAARWDTRQGWWDSRDPVQVVQGAQHFEAGSLRWDGLARQLELGGGVALRLEPALAHSPVSVSTPAPAPAFASQPR